jgi:hypothetical protein
VDYKEANEKSGAHEKRLVKIQVITLQKQSSLRVRRTEKEKSFKILALGLKIYQVNPTIKHF